MLTVLVHELGHCFASRSVGARVHGELSCFIFFLFFPFEVVRRKWRGKKTHLFPSPPPSTKRDRNPPLAPRRPRLRRPLVLALQGPLGRGRRPPDAPSTARVLDGRRGRVVRRLWSWTALDQVEGVAAVEQRLARAGDVCGKRRFFFECEREESLREKEKERKKKKKKEKLTFACSTPLDLDFFLFFLQFKKKRDRSSSTSSCSPSTSSCRPTPWMGGGPWRTCC